MRSSPNVDSVTQSAKLAVRWGNRTLAISFVVIVMLTTFPFEFFLQDTALRRSASFPSWLVLHRLDISDSMENVLLFVPFGFGLACFISRRNLRNGTVLFLSLLAGASLSFAVELAQVFMPTRDASWNDVVTNGSGAVVGCVVFQFVGVPILGCLSFLEAKIEAFLSPRRAIAGFLLLAALGFAVSVSLQRTTSLDDWDGSYPLYVGNDPTGAQLWQGHVFELEFASRAISSERAAQVTADSGRLSLSDGLVTSYRFSSGAPFRDFTGASPDLFWLPNRSEASNSGESVNTGPYWLGSQTPASRIAENAKKTNQFTLRVVCAPLLTSEAPFSRIVSFSQDPYHLNFILSQEGPNLVFGLRTPLTGREGEPALVAPGVFANHDPKQITLTYDGSALLLYVNGKKDPHSVRLSPGAALLRHFLRLRAPDLSGYAVVYEFLLFVPLGLLLAFAARSKTPLGLSQGTFLLAGAVFPPSLLEAVLANVRGGNYNWQEAALGVGVVLGSAALCNLDGRVSR